MTLRTLPDDPASARPGGDVAPTPGAVQTSGLLAAIRRRTLLWTLALSVLALGSAVICLGIGPTRIAPGAVLAVLGEHLGLGSGSATPSDHAIVWGLRAPRVLLGLAVGAALALCGTALQAMVRNVLADPYVLGISSGASTGAAAAILFGIGAGAGAYALPLGAFLGALGASFLVLVMARSAGRVTAIRLLLAGIAVGYALSAATNFLVFASDDPEGSRSVMFWMLGSLSLARWDATLVLTCVVVLLSFLVLLGMSTGLDALTVGDETALALGVRPESMRIRLLVVVSLCTGVAVAAAGAIGFVGLVVPHLARRLVGTAHRRVLPVTALLGSVLLVWADALGRVVMAPRELPIGIITALVGAPFLLVLVRRMSAKRGD